MDQEFQNDTWLVKAEVFIELNIAIIMDLPCRSFYFIPSGKPGILAESSIMQSQFDVRALQRKANRHPHVSHPHPTYGVQSYMAALTVVPPVVQKEPFGAPRREITVQKHRSIFHFETFAERGNLGSAVSQRRNHYAFS